MLTASEERANNPSSRASCEMVHLEIAAFENKIRWQITAREHTDWCQKIAANKLPKAVYMNNDFRF